MKKPIKIVLLEDDRLDEELIRSRLKEDGMSFVMKRVSTPSSFFKLIREWQPDLVLSDYSVPGFSGNEALAHVREKYPDLPFIILTATIGEETAISCIREGAWDYILKQNMIRLVPAIKNAIALKSERSVKERYRKQMESSVEEQSLLLHNIEIHIWYLVDEDKYGVVNNAHAAFFGMKPSGMENSKIRDVLPSRAADIMVKWNREAFRSGRKLQKEIWIGNAEGEERCLFITWIPRLRKPGEVENVICTAEDITGLIRSKEDIRASEEKYRLMFENTGTAIVICNNDGTILMSNKKFAALTGYGSEETDGRLHFSTFLAEKDWKRLMEFQETLQPRIAAPAEYEVLMKKKSGEVRQVYVQVTIIPQTGNRIISMIDITLLKKTQEELINKEKDLTALLEHSPIPQIYEDFSEPKKYILTLRQKNIRDIRKYFSKNREEYRRIRSLIGIIGMNRAFRELLGIRDQKELEEKLFDIVTEDSTAMFIDGLLKVMEGEMVFEGETRYHDVHGREILAKTCWIVVPTHEENLDMVVVSIIDISRQRLAEQKEKQYSDNLRLLSQNALEILETTNMDDLYRQIGRQLHMVTDNSIIIISSFDAGENRLVTKAVFGEEECIEKLLKMTGGDDALTVDSLTGNLKNELLSNALVTIPGGIRQLYPQIDSSGTAGKPEELLGLESVMAMGFHSEGSLLGAAFILLRKGHRPVISEIIGTLVKQTSIALQKQNMEDQIKTLSSAVDHSYAMVIITGLDGTIEYVNPRLLQVTGYSFEEIRGRKPGMFKAGNYPSSFYQTLWQTITSGKEWRGEFENVKKNGEKYWVLASISGVRNEKQEITHFVAVEEDITERKRMEQELIAAKEKAEESDRLKSAFLANLSHEIRTPLNAIAGFSELITQVNLTDDEQKEYFGIIRSNVTTLTKLIDDIIDFSKLELGQTSYEEVECDLDDLLRELQLSFQEEVKNLRKKVEIRINPLSVRDMQIMTDPVRLRQILTNLLGNAVKFTQEGYVEMGYMVEKDTLLRCYVMDTGIGIPKEKLSMIFDRFRQADDSTTRQYGGTGLGLAISKGLVEMMGGEIQVKSVHGKGTTFSFTIPLKKADKERKPADLPEAGWHVHGADWNGKHIVIVENDDSNYRMFEAALGPTMVQLIRAYDGGESVRICSDRSDVDLILAAIYLPDMDGFQVAENIRSVRKDIPVIAYSSYPKPDDYRKSIAAGCVEYLSNPTQISTLIETLRKYLDT